MEQRWITGRTPLITNAGPAGGTQGMLFPSIPPEVTRKTNEITAKLN